MSESLKTQLLGQDPEKLVELIFDIAGESEISWAKIERLVSKPSDNSKRFVQRLNDIKNRGGFIPWKYTSQFADKLTDLLEDLNSGVSSPEEGFRLICQFYKADSFFFEMADDSSGEIGGVFRNFAADIFSKFASQITDKNLIINEFIELMKNDDYGARDELISHVHEFLSEKEMRLLIELIENGKADKDEYVSSWMLESIAKQLKDAPLFESIVRRHQKNPNAKSLVKIAEVYFSSGDIEKAQEILNTIKDQDSYGRYEQEELQKNIYQRQGNTAELFKIVYAAFQNHFSSYTLKDLLAVSGDDRRLEFINEAKIKIAAKKDWHSIDTEFLMEIDDPDSLEFYVLKYQEKIQLGVFYSEASLADYLVDKKKYLAASVLYRGLIAETLKKAKAKYYHHVINYLEILDHISPKIKSWEGLDTHTLFLQYLKKKHALKKSLWSKYKA